eukprot:TRINITY_DN1389_c0_g2_i6.p1 TRINITY_DN1389_c0_g2~~TRINITY_DN1389_c0_g2_i6.p1  ORF type:complete len:591 (-),score=102.97 TRINITY_DN1389_c0_g2_i6:24-1796(-)
MDRNSWEDLNQPLTGGINIPLNKSVGIDITEVEERPSTWAADGSVHKRLVNLYQHWQARGFLGTVLSRFFSVLSLLFSILLVGFVFFCIDYDELFTNYHFFDSVTPPKVDSSFEILGAVVLSICLLFWGHQVLRLLSTVVQSWKTRTYCYEVLGLDAYMISTMAWNDVLQTIVEKQGNTLRRDRPLSHLEIVNIIMMEENFMIALLNTNTLNLKIPLLGTTYITQTTEWMLRIALFNWIFDDEGSIKRRIMEGMNPRQLASDLRRRFILFGVVSFLLCPLALVAVIIYTIFRYGEEVKNRPGALLGVRQWSTFAKWRIRDFNELPHLFEERLSISQSSAKKYVGYFHSHLTGVLASFVSFVLGSLVALLIIAEFYDSNFLINVDFLGTNGLLLLGILTAGLAYARVLVPPARASSDTLNSAMVELAKSTHYLPTHWVERAHLEEIRDEFYHLFQYTAILWIMEFVSILTTPLVLIFSLPSSADEIIEFCQKKAERLPGIGFVCSFSLFPEIETGTVYGGSPDQVVDVETGRHNFDDGRFDARDGKMEISIINFASAYPGWDSSGQRNLLESVYEYQHSNVLYTIHSFNKV